ncbi:MAG TPA: hypothetical protein VLL75_21240 [Vicinamibacteria bacterium]|nr:hypothetical protein [Vicinamibacteria bacterium]
MLLAFERLYKEKALHTLVRGTLAPALLKRLLKPEFGRRTSLGVPDEAWASLAARFALDNPLVGMPLAEALNDRLGWDREPARTEDWQRLAEERPLEALWVAALSEDKSVRKAFPKLAAAAVQGFRASPACTPPSWTFVDMLLDLQASYVREIDRLEKADDDLERRVEAERQRSEDLREEVKRLRREGAELRAERAAAEKKAAAALEARSLAARAPESVKLEEAERRLRKAEKEAEHLRRELERRDALEAPGAPVPPLAATSPPPEAVPAPLAPRGLAIADDPNPRRRVLRQILKKLFKKGKIGASHTHEDNVYRGVPDHEKGIAKEAMDLLYREGLLMPKPTTTDPHVSLRPERTGEVQAIVAGEIENPRLARFVEEVA